MYIPYQGFLVEAKEEMQKEGIKLKHDKIHKFLIDSTNLAIQTFQGTSTHLNQDVMMLLTESVHYLHTNQIYYVDTSLAQRLMDSDLSLQISNLRLPHRIFEICFQEDLEYEGNKIPSCLVMIQADEPIVSAMQNHLNSTSFNMKLLNINNTVAVRFRSPLGGICHACFGIKENEGRNIDQIIDDLGMFANTSLGRVKNLDPVEKDLEKRLMRIIFGMLCYLNTKEPDVLDWKNKNRPSFVEKPNEMLLGSMMERTVGWHLRKGHWRFLKHERYKHEDDGSPRCVWVRAAEISKDNVI